MASDAPAFALSKQDSAAISLEGPQAAAFRERRPETVTRSLRAYDRAFFLRVADANGVLADMMKSSEIKVAESLELLAKVNDLLRR